MSRTSLSQNRRHKRKPAALTVEPLEDRTVPSFLAPVSYQAGGSQTIVADFNGDSHLDLAVANGGGVSILLGNGDGSFSPAQNYSVGSGPRSVAVGDFNADGKLDLATANFADLSVLLGNGDGTFQPATNSDIGSNPLSVAVGDFNGDGTLDVAATSNLYFPSPSGYNVGSYFDFANVLLGHGDGTFAGPITTAVSGPVYPDVGPTSLAAADFNSDGRDDLATAGSTFLVLLSNADGTFNGLNEIGVASAIAAGDVNADGNIDLVTGVGPGIEVLLGTGLGSFIVPGQSYGAGNYPVGIAIGDFNADGIMDVAAASNYYDDHEVSVLLGTATGTFSLPVNSVTGANPRALVVGDFNRDGWLDAATAGNDLSVLINDRSWPPLNAPSITISDASIMEGNAGTTNMVFTVNVSVAYSQPVTVQFSTSDGAATAGSDYVVTSGTVTFAPGQTSKTIAVPIIGDRLPEQDKGFFVNLSNAANAFITDDQGIGLIRDDEPRINFSGILARREGNHGTTRFTFTVSLSVAYDQPVTVNFATADGGGNVVGAAATVADHDYEPTSGTLTFAPGQTTATITVLVYGDRKVEPVEYFSVLLSSPSSNALLGNWIGVGKILDDDS